MTMHRSPATQDVDRLPSAGSERADLGFDHGAIGRFNAWFFTAFAGYTNHIARDHKAAAFAGLHAGAVLEIGAGTGANLDYLAPGTRLYALEPSRPMRPRLSRRCSEKGIDVTVLAAPAEAIPLPDASVDEVICSLVLCTVADPTRALAEIRRVLRPGGRFRFVEHTAATRPGARALVQRAIRRPWGWLFDGCDPHRDTPAAIRDAGFRDVRLEQRKFRHSVFWPVNTAAWGIAMR